MFSITLGQYLSLTPGLHNIALGDLNKERNLSTEFYVNSGRTQGLRTQSRSTAGGQDCLREAVKRLECLTPAERDVLSNKTAELWSGLLGQKEVVDTASTSWQDLFNTAIKAVESGNVGIAKKKSGFVLNDKFLKTQSPFLQNARGFKTR